MKARLRYTEVGTALGAVAIVGAGTAVVLAPPTATDVQRASLASPTSVTVEKRFSGKVAGFDTTLAAKQAYDTATRTMDDWAARNNHVCRYINHTTRYTPTWGAVVVTVTITAACTP